MRNQCGEALSMEHGECMFIGRDSYSHHLQRDQEHPEKVLRLKMLEAAYALLNTDERYIPTLFDFTGKYQMEMFDLLQKPMEKEIGWKELSIESHNKLN